MESAEGGNVSCLGELILDIFWHISCENVEDIYANPSIILLSASPAGTIG